jgi:uncharacterized protein YdaU (DUF1376 family)
MSSPFMQFYVADYLADTQHLTTEQHGAYLLLLFAMWRAVDGEIDADDGKLARIARLTLTRWNKIKGDVMALLSIENGKVTQKRLRAELQKAVEKSLKRAEAGRNGGNAKALKDKEVAVANARDLPRHSSESEPEPEEDSEDSASPQAARGSSGASDLFPDTTPKIEATANPVTEAFDLYDAFAESSGWTRCQNRHDARTSKMAKRLKECGGVEGFRAALKRAAASDFCCGRAPPRNGQPPFLMHVDFLLQRQSFTRLMEGHYDNRASSKNHDRIARIEAGARSAAGLPAREHPGSGLPAEAMGSARAAAE